jgi:Na+-transporting methylmalonyl-CoA/oxaloacetate decarboxylase gamma subunit
MEGFSGGLIVAVVDFFMVFLVLSGLALAIKGMQGAIALFEPKEQPKTELPKPEPTPPQTEGPAMKAHIAAIFAAIQEYTGLPAGAFKIDRIEPVDLAMQPISGIQNKAHVAAIAAAINEYTAMPEGSFRITGIKPLGSTTNSWKIAGRLELMGTDTESK